MLVPGALTSPAKLLDGPRVWAVGGRGLLMEVDAGSANILAVVDGEKSGVRRDDDDDAVTINIYVKNGY
jgi:hypothetical protein